MPRSECLFIDLCLPSGRPLTQCTVLLSEPVFIDLSLSRDQILLLFIEVKLI